MATWRDHPQWQRGYLWIHKPTVVFAAQLQYTNTTTYGKNATNDKIWNYLFFQNVTVGDSSASDVREGMTLLLGTTAGAYDLGRVRVKQVVNVNPPDEYALKVWASNNIHDGEVYPQSGAYITVLDQYLPWFKPPYYGIGSGYVDGDLGPGGATHSQFPIANAGPGYVGVAAAATYGEFTYDGTGSASSFYYLGPVANAFDNNNATTWTSSVVGSAPQWIQFQFSASKTVEEYGVTPRSGGSPDPAPTNWTLLGSNNGTDWDTLDTQTAQAFSAGVEKKYTISTPGSYTYYRLNITAFSGGLGYVMVAEFNLYGTDAPPVEASFSGADSYAVAYDAVLGAYGSDIMGDVTSITASSEYDVYVAENTIDDDSGTSWRSLTTTNEYLIIEFAAARKPRKLVITPVVANMAPTALYLSGGPVGETIRFFKFENLTTGWSAGVPRTFYIDYDYPQDGFTRFRLDMSALGGGARVSIAELEFMEEDRTDAYSWDVGDGTITTGASTSEDITATFPTGFRYVHLTVTDSSTYTGTKHVPVVAIDSDYTGVVRNFQITSHLMAPHGQSMTFRVFEDIDLSDYPPNTMVMYWEDENIGGESGSLSGAGPAGRGHIKFIGYLDTENVRIQANEYGTEKYVDLNCEDIGWRLRKLPAFQMVAQRESSVTYIYEMEHANMDRLAYLLLRWCSTSAEIADFIWSKELDRYGFAILSTEQGNLYDAVDALAQTITFRFTCDKYGVLRFLRDPQLQGGDNRTDVVIEDIDETDWTEIDYTYQRWPRHHWVWLSAIAASQTDADDTNVLTSFMVGPGPVPGQGVSSVEISDRIDDGGGGRLERGGNEYAARINPQFSYFNVKLAHGADTGIDPARMEWVRMTISAATAAQRGYAFTDTRFLPVEVRIDYDHDAMTKAVSLVLEQEATGKPLTQYIPE